jgi:hypothetical protein
MAASRETFFEPFEGAFRLRARKALKGDAVDLPFVLARRLDKPGPDELAEFMAGVLAPPTPAARPEPWQVEGLLYRCPTGPPIVGSLRVRHFPLDTKALRAELTGLVLRALPLATIRDGALAGLEGSLQFLEIAGEAGWRGVALDDVERAREPVHEARKARPGRPRLSDQFLERIAIRYVELARVRRDVLVALAAEESERAGREIPRETIRDWVRKATERRYLAPGKPGRAEARPGPRLKRKEK